MQWKKDFAENHSQISHNHNKFSASDRCKVDLNYDGWMITYFTDDFLKVILGNDLLITHTTGIAMKEVTC